MKNNTIEELIQLKQDGKIGWCELALRSSSHCAVTMVRLTSSGVTTTVWSPTTITQSSTSKRQRAVSMTTATSLRTLSLKPSCSISVVLP